MILQPFLPPHHRRAPVEFVVIIPIPEILAGDPPQGIDRREAHGRVFIVQIQHEPGNGAMVLFVGRFLDGRNLAGRDCCWSGTWDRAKSIR